jgi:hypothetical protein
MYIHHLLAKTTLLLVKRAFVFRILKGLFVEGTVLTETSSDGRTIRRDVESVLFGFCHF